MEMFTASNVAYWATWLTVAAFFVAASGYFLEGKYLPFTMYIGLCMANGAIAIMANP